MSINRIFKREAKRQIKHGIKLKKAGVKNIVLPFIMPETKAGRAAHVHPRHLRGQS